MPKSLGDFNAWCRGHGLPITAGRHVVANVVLHAKDYPDLDQLRSRIAAVNPRISLDTVYRTLRLLVKLGLIERHKFKGAPLAGGRSRKRATAT